MLETCLFKKIYFLKNRYQQEKNIVENYKESVWMTGCIQNIYIYIYINLQFGKYFDKGSIIGLW